MPDDFQDMQILAGSGEDIISRMMLTFFSDNDKARNGPRWALVKEGDVTAIGMSAANSLFTDNVEWCKEFKDGHMGARTHDGIYVWLTKDPVSAEHIPAMDTNIAKQVFEKYITPQLNVEGSTVKVLGYEISLPSIGKDTLDNSTISSFTTETGKTVLLPQADMSDMWASAAAHEGDIAVFTNMPASAIEHYKTQHAGLSDKMIDADIITSPDIQYATEFYIGNAKSANKLVMAGAAAAGLAGLTVSIGAIKDAGRAVDPKTGEPAIDRKKQIAGIVGAITSVAVPAAIIYREMTQGAGMGGGVREFSII